MPEAGLGYGGGHDDGIEVIQFRLRSRRDFEALPIRASLIYGSRGKGV